MPFVRIVQGIGPTSLGLSLCANGIECSAKSRTLHVLARYLSNGTAKLDLGTQQRASWLFLLIALVLRPKMQDF